MKILIVVESPAKADKIQGYLGKDYVVLASKGHIADLGKGGYMGLGIDIENDFRPRYVLMDDKIDILDKILDAAKKCDQILIATDPDREGEAIAWHIRERLDGIDKPIKRIVFHEVKKAALIKAIKNAGDVNMDIFRAQEARRILDRIVGFTASPFLMNFMGPKLSAGRVQSVVTRMVVDREREIEAFVPETFWTIQVSLSKDGNSGFITKYPYKLTDQQEAKDMRKKLSVKDYVVTDVIAAEEQKHPSAPLVTASLQRLMSRVHGISADRTMKAAQSLYENGYCTYIRTDSVRSGDEALADAREWLKNNNYPLSAKVRTYKNKDASQDAHECIRPTDIELLPYDNYAIIDPDEKLVYEAIWRQFLASQMAPAVYNTLKVTACVDGDSKAVVKTSGKAIKEKGYLDMLGVTNMGKIDIPNLSKGDKLTTIGPKPVKMEKKQTQPPPRFSEEKLIKQLEDRSIGRPATYAELLSKITLRNYVEKRGNVFHPTDLGKKVVDVLTDHFTFMDYDYTALLEKKLDLIENSTLDKVHMLNDFYSAYKDELAKGHVALGGKLCRCGSPMVVRVVKKTGDKFLGCSSYPICKNTNIF